MIARHVRPEVDLVVCEGYKRERHPKIEVARASVSRELVLGDDELLAVVADFHPKTSRPVFAPADVDVVAELVVQKVARG